MVEAVRLRQAAALARAGPARRDSWRGSLAHPDTRGPGLERGDAQSGPPDSVRRGPIRGTWWAMCPRIGAARGAIARAYSRRTGGPSSSPAAARPARHTPRRPAREASADASRTAERWRWRGGRGQAPQRQTARLSVHALGSRLSACERLWAFGEWGGPGSRWSIGRQRRAGEDTVLSSSFSCLASLAASARTCSSAPCAPQAVSRGKGVTAAASHGAESRRRT